MMLHTPLTGNTKDHLALLTAWLFSLVIVLFPIFDYDLYWHLANGREMAQSGRIISEDIFSYTHFGEKFENHEWLAQIILYLVWQTMGSYGLLGLKLLITILVTLLVFRTVRILGGQPWLAALLCIFAVLAGFHRYIERPELFSLLNFSLISFILYGYRAGRLTPRALWLIPLIMVMWNWLHGAVYGLALLSLFVAGENIKYFFPKLRRDAAGDHVVPSALNHCYAITMLAMLIDPFGLRSYGMFFVLLGGEGSAITDKIIEMLPTTSMWRRYIPFIFLLAWTSLLAVRHIRRIDITQLILLLAFGSLALRYSRVTGITSIALIPIITDLIIIAARQADNRLQKAWGTVMLLAAVVFVAGYGYKVKFIDKSTHAFGYHQLDETYLPVGSARFVKAMGLSGNYYNTGHFGGYLSYFMAPERKIFQSNLILFYGDTYRFVSQPNELARWNLNYAFVGDNDELRILFPKQQWARVYRDTGAVLVLRRTPQNQALIQQYELHFFFPNMRDDELHKQTEDVNTLPRLAEEMGVYLAFCKNERIAESWARILAANPDLRNHPRIQQLLQQAQRYNSSSKLAQLVGYQ